jgi:putative NADH-flavin reductase
MKIAVFGSTGGNGRLILGEGIRRGHQITAFARRSGALTDVFGLAGVIEGDGTNATAVGKAVAGQQAVIMSVSGREPGVSVAIASTVTAAMRSLGVSRLVATSAYGLVAKRPYVLASIVRQIFAKNYAEQLAADQVIMASDLDWTILRATRLVSGPAQRPGRLSTELFTSGPYSISRTAYALALLDLAEHDTYTRQIVNITR